jgi:hypothetical protein
VKRAKNSPIGTVECPHKSCTQTCQVFKFRPRTEGRTSVFSGKYYAECPDHGRIGSDGNPATSRYIETHYKPAGAGQEKSASPAPEPKPAARTAPATSKPAKATDNPKPASGRPWWQPLID